MSLSGMDAVVLLSALESRCKLYREDGTDKMWSYKLVKGQRCEFTFDPNTTTKLTVRLDTKPPSVVGLVKAQNTEGNSISTALSRVFSGEPHIARWKVQVESAAALVSLIEYLEKITAY